MVLARLSTAVTVICRRRALPLLFCKSPSLFFFSTGNAARLCWSTTTTLLADGRCSSLCL